MEKSMGSCDDCVRCDGTVQDLSSACFNRKTIKSSAFEHKNTFWGKQPLQVFTVLNLRKTQFMVSLLSKHHYSNQLVCCNKTKCCPSHFFITAMSLYTGTAVTPDESWQCSQTIGGVDACKGCIQHARICPFSRPAASSHLCNGCFYWWNRVTWEQLVIYNAYIACLGASGAEDVGRTVRVRAQCLTPIFTAPCSDRLLSSTACWAVSASI